MMGKLPKFGGLLFCLMMVISIGQAQFVEFSPLPQFEYKKQAPHAFNARTAEVNQLPFWDDFASGMDTLSWIFSGSSFSSTIGNNPPSFGVIVLDGVDETGKPYSRETRELGAGDYVTSHPFDLSGVDESDRESLYLSFFWQAGGQAEMPDEGDALTLQFLTADSVWTTVWEQFGGVERDPELFSQEIIGVDSVYQHDSFQFRFVNFGRLSGPFDTWIIDYVYFNDGRNEDNLAYLDRALTRENKFLLGDYGAVPLAFFQDFQTDDFTPIDNEFNNLERRFRAMEYSVSLQDASGTQEIRINQNTPFNPVPNSLERREFSSNPVERLPVLEEETDLLIKTYLTTGDQSYFEISQGDTTFFDQIDFRKNDTVQSRIPIRDYFAYDVGRADYAAGINQRSGILAVRYEVSQPVYLTGLSIDFTNPLQVDQPVDIQVWTDLEAPPIYQKEALIRLKEAEEDILFFPIDTNIQVNGTYFVGFSQFTNDFIHVGLSKENDQGDQIFYNVVGAWVQNEEVRGSLLIRPHISLTAPFQESSLPSETLRYFPNPVRENLYLEASYQEIRIFDSFGREIFPERTKSETGEMINFANQLPGIYVINLINKKESKSIRILVN